VLFAPAQLVFLWRNRRQGIPGLIGQITAGTVAAGALGALLYSHWWLGLHSFAGTLEQGQPLSSASLLGVINWSLRRSAFAPVAGPLTAALVSIPTIAFVLWMSLRVRDAASLARAFAWIAVVYLLVASPAYWPWYAALPVTLLIAADTQRFLWIMIMLCVVARVVAPLDLLQLQGVLSMPLAKGAMTGLGSLLPLLVLVAWYVRAAWLARLRKGAFAGLPATPPPAAFTSPPGTNPPPT
jgi:hypothetical protein